MIRDRIAAGPIASASTGRTYAAGVSFPATGSQSEADAEDVDEADADRKSGMIPSTTLLVVNASSVRRPWPRRVSTPIATPSGTATATASEEGQQRQLERGGQPLRDDRPTTGSWEISEVPRSPVNRPWR